MDKAHPIILSLGGSLVIPANGIDTGFLKEFNTFIREKINEDWKFFVVVGGGATARHYIDAAKRVVGTVTDWDLDWLGIHTTRLNAHLVRTIFQDIAHPRIIENYEHKIEDLTQPLVIASGWKPGCSTDFDAVTLAKDYGASILINMSNITAVYDKDPNKNTDAVPYTHMTWEQMEAIVGDTWIPGANNPFDPLATKLAKDMGLTVYAIGKDLKNLGNILSGHEFLGTVISSS
jgi:uridylate kinase